MNDILEGWNEVATMILIQYIITHPFTEYRGMTPDEIINTYEYDFTSDTHIIYRYKFNTMYNMPTKDDVSISMRYIVGDLFNGLR